MRKLLASTAFLMLYQFSFGQNALDFDGNNDRVQTTYEGISGTGARTVEAWIKTTANAISNQQVIMDYGTFATGQRFTFNVLWSNAIRLEVSGSGLSGHIAVNDGNWHHVAGVYDPNASNQLSLYVDGVLDTAGNIPTTINTGSSVDLRIGERIDGVNNFTGSIDEVRFWDVARSASEIAQNRNAEFCSLPANLKAYYTMNHGVAAGSNSGINKALDAVAGNDGTLNNFSLSGTTSNWVNGSGITAGLSVSGMTTSVCDSFVSPSGNHVWSSSGKYQDTLTNAGGCDSLINVNLTVKNGLFIQINDTVCEPYTSPSGKYTYETSGTYYDTVVLPNGCDGIYELNLGITIIDSTVNKTGNDLTANQTNADHYIWLDCDDDFSQIGGSTSQTYSPTKNGNYAARVTLNGCVDTTECVSVTGVGIGDIQTEGIRIYPNPMNDELNIDLPNEHRNVEVKIISISGKTVYQSFHNELGALKIKTSSYPEGVYFLQFIGSGLNVQEKLVIKH